MSRPDTVYRASKRLNIALVRFSREVAKELRLYDIFDWLVRRLTK